MTMRRSMLLVVAAQLAVAAAVAAFDGIPYAYFTKTVSTSIVNITSAQCGNVDGPVVLQIQTNGIYYRLDSATATPVATSYVGNVGDVIQVKQPQLFGAIRSGGADATLAGACLDK